MQFEDIQLGDEYKPGEYNELKVVRYGDKILTYINGVLVDTMTDSYLASGSVGFRNGNSEANSYQYIRVATPVLTASTDFKAGEDVPDVTVETVGEDGNPITEALSNEMFGVKIVTPKEVTDIRLANEYGLSLGVRELQKQDNQDGTVTWTLQTSIATVGNGRTITVYTSVNGGEFVSSGASFTIDILAPKPVVYSASIEETAVINVPVTLKVVTDKTVDKIVVENEYGLKMGTVSSSFVETDEGREWTVTMKIGTAGTRSFLVSGKNKTGGLSDAVTTNSVTEIGRASCRERV